MLIILTFKFTYIHLITFEQYLTYIHFQPINNKVSLKNNQLNIKRDNKSEDLNGESIE